MHDRIVPNRRNGHYQMSIRRKAAVDWRQFVTSQFHRFATPNSNHNNSSSVHLFWYQCNPTCRICATQCLPALFNIEYTHATVLESETILSKHFQRIEKGSDNEIKNTCKTRAKTEHHCISYTRTKTYQTTRRSKTSL